MTLEQLNLVSSTTFGWYMQRNSNDTGVALRKKGYRGVQAAVAEELCD
jgi:hypothetical protein